jgi:hypothetical protein
MWASYWDQEISLFRDFLTCHEVGLEEVFKKEEETKSLEQVDDMINQAGIYMTKLTETAARSIGAAYEYPNWSSTVDPGKGVGGSLPQKVSKQERKWPVDRFQNTNKRVTILVVRRDKKNNSMGVGYQDESVDL